MTVSITAIKDSYSNLTCLGPVAQETGGNVREHLIFCLFYILFFKVKFFVKLFFKSKINIVDPSNPYIVEQSFIETVEQVSVATNVKATLILPKDLYNIFLFFKFN